MSAQTTGTVGMSASRIEYDGFLASGAATLTSAIRFDTRSVALGAQGSWTMFESGNPIFQLTSAAAWLKPMQERWGLELSAAAGGYRYADVPATGHLLTRGRLHFLANRAGGWVSMTTGASADGVPLELAVGAWSVHDRVGLVGTLTRTWLDARQHTDIAGAAKWTTRRWELEARAGARPWASNAGLVGDARTGVWAEVSTLVRLAERISLTLSGGKYPSDPVRGVLGANHFSAGVQMAVGRASPTSIVIIPGALRALASDTTAAATNAPRLEIVASAEQHALRVHVTGATSVEIMGDFTEWRPLPMSRVADHVWETRVELTVGVHRLNVRLNGGEWVVPGGARAENGEFGGAVGVIVVR